MLILEAKTNPKNYWKTIWQRRSLLFYVTRRDLTVRYKQTLVGISWVLIRPILTMLIFSLLFGSIAKLDSSGLPYGFVVFAGIVPWFLFANLFGETSNSLIANATMVTKVNCPRLIFPISTLIVGLVDFSLGFLLLLAMMLWYSVPIQWEIIFFPIFILSAAMLAIGLGLMAATLNARYRDFQQLIPFVLQLGIYLSPVGYLNQLVPKKWELLYSLNPIAGIINGFRWSLAPNVISPYWPGLIYAVVVSMAMLYLGIKVFRAAEDNFSDTI
jgi:lipopolysaccharide transport system permease protein